MKKFMLIIGVVVTGLMVFVLIMNTTNIADQDEVSTEDIKQKVAGYSSGNLQAESASITSDELIVTESDNSETVYDILENDFFVSIAPFIDQTHPCYDHDLIGCQGEMINEDFDVYIEDEDGNVVVDETITSADDGFIDLWLPRDENYTINISSEGKTAESEFSTFSQDNTCITTIQLT
ncbi:hypothetical protein SAMN05421734_104189 [Pelagirhabdus alkalitolerans]|uniref:Uncharacterized protein n=1 Tax=Pelagirhabdus alkalitolerans TaxID=1612202 RepID=A0A1G6J0T7_9BACI|nr:CueP family metal-binding protein [Pelagirhabdus alkalitolerans]SDC12183.1 hypothetical protein SAMN05421734_104189 [Pelagirhabdus alkalitolerans]